MTTITLPSGAHVAHYREANGAIRAYVINSPTGEFSTEQYLEYQAWLDSRSRSCDPRDYLGEVVARAHAAPSMAEPRRCGMKTGIRIVYNRLLAGWYIVRGPHQSPIGGVFATKAEAQAYLRSRK